MTEALNVGIVLFDDVEELDFVGPFEVFASANEASPREASARGVTGGVNVFTVAEEAAAIRGWGGLRVLPDYTFSDCPRLDILVVPGGEGRKREMHNPTLLRFVIERAAECRLVTSVCTGAFILAEAGLLRGKRATTHHSALQELRERGDVMVCEERFVHDGKFITAAGISAGIDMALYVVEMLLGAEVAKAAARRMEYQPLTFRRE